MRAWDARAGVSDWTTWLRGTFAQRLRSLAQFVEKGGWSWNWRFGAFLFTGEVDTVVPTMLVFFMSLFNDNYKKRSLEKVCVDVRVVHVHELSSSFGTFPAPLQSWILKTSIWRNLKANSSQRLTLLPDCELTWQHAFVCVHLLVLQQTRHRLDELWDQGTDLLDKLFLDDFHTGLLGSSCSFIFCWGQESHLWTTLYSQVSRLEWTFHAMVG